MLLIDYEDPYDYEMGFDELDIYFDAEERTNKITQ